MVPEKAEHARLRAQYKEMKKSTMKELRKVARTESVLRADEQRAKDKSYTEKMRKAAGSLQDDAKARNDAERFRRNARLRRQIS